MLAYLAMSSLERVFKGMRALTKERETIELILQIKNLMLEYKRRLRDNYKFYSQDLLNNLFKYPYTKIGFIQNDMNVSRLTAANYLNTLADDGVQNALPKSDENRLTTQVEQVVAQVLVAQQRLTEHEQGFARSQANPVEQVDHDAQTVKILYGENFVALPLCNVSNRDQQQASLDNAGQLLPRGPQQVDDWLQMNALARPSVARLMNLLNASELANADEAGPTDTSHVIQLPHDPDERWGKCRRSGSSGLARFWIDFLGTGIDHDKPDSKRRLRARKLSCPA